MQRIMDIGSRILSYYTSRPSSFLSRYRYRTITLKPAASRAARAEINPAHYLHLLSSTSSHLVRVANEHVDLERLLRETTKQLSRPAAAASNYLRMTDACSTAVAMRNTVMSPRIDVNRLPTTVFSKPHCIESASPMHTVAGG